MYKLETGNVDNSVYINKLENNISLVDQLRQEYGDNVEVIKSFIFLPIDENNYDVLSCILTCSDEFGFPLRKQTADLCYFILVNNHAFYEGRSPVKITSLNHARALYDMYDGDYTKIDIQLGDEKTTPRFKKFLARHRLLWPEKNIYWEIPVSYYKNKETNKSMCCLGGAQWATFANVKIGDGQLTKVPRSLWLKFYEAVLTKGTFAVENSDDIVTAFDETLIEPVQEVLEYLGYSVYMRIDAKDDCEYFYSTSENALCLRPLNNRATYADEDTKDLWKYADLNTYRFLNRGVEYLPTKPIAGKIIIYR